MTRFMKRLSIGCVCLAALGGCGLRGELEQPEPLWGDPKPEEVTELSPVAEAQPSRVQRVVRTTEGSYEDPVTGQTVWVRNANGGEKPKAAPVEPIAEGGLAPPAG